MNYMSGARSSGEGSQIVLSLIKNRSGARAGRCYLVWYHGMRGAWEVVRKADKRD
jgi:hypothetical protein